MSEIIKSFSCEEYKTIIVQRDEEIAQLKSALYGCEYYYSEKLSVLQAREADLVEALDYYKESTRTEVQGDQIVEVDNGDMARKALSNSTEHTEKWLAEVKAKTLEDAAKEFENESDSWFVSDKLKDMANELRNGK